MRRVLGLLASALVVGAVIAAWRPRGDVGYIEIKTVPVAPVMHTVLYIDFTKLAPIRKGNAILRQRVGTLKLQADDLAGSLVPLCDVVVIPHHHRDNFAPGAAAALPMPLQWHRPGGDGGSHVRELSMRIRMFLLRQRAALTKW